MPSVTKPVPDLVIHVPVDKVEIVNGPTPQSMTIMMYQMNQGAEGCPREFTLKTPASKSTFRRTITIKHFWITEGNDAHAFVGIYSGRIISGMYSVSKRTGWFNLD